MEALKDKEMTFLEHLEELRRRILLALLGVFIASIVGYIFGKKIISFLGRPAGKLYFLAPPEAFLIRVKLALLVGIFLAMPFILYQLWLFVSPGLTDRERKMAFPLVALGTFFFYAGVLFALFVAFPIGIKVLLSFGGKELVGLLNASKYFDFLAVLVLIFGFLFELPVVVSFLTRLGVVDPRSLSKRRREIIVGIFILAAIVTPSVDFLTQLLLAVPLIVLFELSLLFGRIVKKENP